MDAERIACWIVHQVLIDRNFIQGRDESIRVAFQERTCIENADFSAAQHDFIESLGKCFFQRRLDDERILVGYHVYWCETRTGLGEKHDDADRCADNFDTEDLKQERHRAL